MFGLKLPSPLFMSPIGVIGMCAQDGHGDIATGLPVDYTFRVTQLETFSAPEPGTWAMMIIGFGLAGSAIRRQRVGSLRMWLLSPGAA